MELLIKDVKALKNAVPIVLKQAANRKKWCFYGEMGTGKTTFIKELCAYLGVQEGVTSPTYSLINEYLYMDTKSKQSASIYHFDLYRLNSLEEALDIGIEEYLENSSYCFLEWPELIEAILPEEVVKISLEIVEDSMRKIVFL